MDFIVNKIIHKFIKKEIIKKEDKEIYIYGLKQTFVTIINLITIIMLGILFNKLFLSLLFIISYIPIRIYAGGYHARNNLRCYIYSVIMQIIILFLLDLSVLKNNISILIISLTASIIGLILAPVEDLNKILDELEIKIYRKKSIVNIAIMQTLTLGLLLLGFNQYALVISLAIGSSTFMMILGKVYNISHTKNNI